MLLALSHLNNIFDWDTSQWPNTQHNKNDHLWISMGSPYLSRWNWQLNFDFFYEVAWLTQINANKWEKKSTYTTSDFRSLN